MSKIKYESERKWYGSVQHFNSEAPYSSYKSAVRQLVKKGKKVPKLKKL